MLYVLMFLLLFVGAANAQQTFTGKNVVIGQFSSPSCPYTGSGTITVDAAVCPANPANCGTTGQPACYGVTRNLLVLNGDATLAVKNADPAGGQTLVFRIVHQGHMLTVPPIWFSGGQAPTFSTGIDALWCMTEDDAALTCSSPITDLTGVLRLTLNTTTTPPGSNIVSAVANGPGNPTDWLGIYAAGSTNQKSFLNWAYLNGSQTAPASGLKSAAVTMKVPVTVGSYEMRFFANDQFTVLISTPFAVK